MLKSDYNLGIIRRLQIPGRISSKTRRLISCQKFNKGGGREAVFFRVKAEAVIESKLINYKQAVKAVSLKKREEVLINLPPLRFSEVSADRWHKI